MIWSSVFEERLSAWYHLRQQVHDQPLETALLQINDWWWRAPIVTKSMTWRDVQTWPDPWDLIGQSGYCDLARALGMLYTVMMLARQDVDSLELVETEDNNLVLINHGKYIMNWSPGTIVNNLSPRITTKRSINSRAFERHIG